MRDTAAEEGGRQRRNLDFPGECSVELDLRKQKENIGTAALGQTNIRPAQPPDPATTSAGLPGQEKSRTRLTPACPQPAAGSRG